MSPLNLAFIMLETTVSVSQHITDYIFLKWYNVL